MERLLSFHHRSEQPDVSSSKRLEIGGMFERFLTSLHALRVMAAATEWSNEIRATGAINQKRTLNICRKVLLVAQLPYAGRMLPKPSDQSLTLLNCERSLHMPRENQNFMRFRINPEIAAPKTIFPTVQMDPVQPHISVMQLINGIVSTLQSGAELVLCVSAFQFVLQHFWRTLCH
jgi:hypothetical protein